MSDERKKFVIKTHEGYYWNDKMKMWPSSTLSICGQA